MRREEGPKGDLLKDIRSDQLPTFCKLRIHHQQENTISDSRSP